MLKLLANQTNKYREIEKDVKKYFKGNGFNVVTALSLCDVNGNYITASTLKSYYKGLPGHSKQINHDDITLMADCLMSADLFLDCGNFITIIDITRSLNSPVSTNKIKRKVNLLSKRLQRALDCNLHFKLFCPYKKRYITKPISKGLVIALNYIDNLQLDPILDLIDDPSSVSSLSFF